NELHVEAGFRLNGSLLREGCVDEFLIYLNPSFLGDAAQGMLDLPAFDSLEKRPRLKLLSTERVGEDLRLLARPAAAWRGGEQVDGDAGAAAVAVLLRRILHQLEGRERRMRRDALQLARQRRARQAVRHRRADMRRFLGRD